MGNPESLLRGCRGNIRSKIIIELSHILHHRHLVHAQIDPWIYKMVLFYGYLSIFQLKPNRPSSAVRFDDENGIPIFGCLG